MASMVEPTDVAAHSAGSRAAVCPASRQDEGGGKHTRSPSGAGVVNHDASTTHVVVAVASQTDASVVRRGSGPIDPRHFERVLTWRA